MNNTPFTRFSLVVGGGGGLVGYPTFEVTEEQMVAVFGKPNSEMSYCEPEKGYEGYWDFTDGVESVSIGFRYGCSRYSGWTAEQALKLDAFLKDTFSLMTAAEAA
jgi:hypothetical protein